MGAAKVITPYFGLILFVVIARKGAAFSRPQEIAFSNKQTGNIFFFPGRTMKHWSRSQLQNQLRYQARAKVVGDCRASPLKLKPERYYNEPPGRFSQTLWHYRSDVEGNIMETHESLHWSFNCQGCTALVQSLMDSDTPSRGELADKTETVACSK